MLALCLERRRTQSGFTGALGQVAVEYYQEKLQHDSLLSTLSGQDRTGEVSSRCMQCVVVKVWHGEWLTKGQLNNLVKSGIVEDYPPLLDKKGSYTAQFEHVSNFLGALVSRLILNHTRLFYSDRT